MKDDFGDRMKMYENVSRLYLTPKTPVIIRIDGKSFHTFTRGFAKPFDIVLLNSMQDAMKYLCENISGCVLGYTQSDEISLVLVDYENIKTSAWFEYNIQKCSSVAASMATMAFNNAFLKNMQMDPETVLCQNDKYNAMFSLRETYQKVAGKAMFDARIFNIPKEEVTNCILWRQNDAARNSIQMVARTYFSHKELAGKSTGEMQDMLFTKHGINWNDYPVRFKRGSCCVKIPVKGKDRPKWTIDNEIPIFKAEGRKYIENLINFN